MSTFPGCVAEPSGCLPELSGVLLPFACRRLSGCAVFVCVSRKFRLAFRRPKCESVAGRIADSTYARFAPVRYCYCTLARCTRSCLACRIPMPGDWLSHTASLGHPLNTPATFSVRPRISATARANSSQSLQRAVRRSADFVRRAAILRGAFAGSTTPLLSLHPARRKADAEKQRASGAVSRREGKRTARQRPGRDRAEPHVTDPPKAKSGCAPALSLPLFPPRKKTPIQKLVNW